jgi:hypothetical protein
MWETTLFLIGAWLTITPPADMLTDSTSVMLLEFNQSMSTAGLFDEENYSITDNLGNAIPIYQIQILDTLIDGAGGISIPDTSLIALQIPKGVFKRSYTTVVSNLTDKDGTAINAEKNTGWYYHSGFAPNLIDVPNLQIRKE